MLTKEWIKKTIYDALAREVWSSTRKRPFMQVRGDWGLGAIEAVEAITQAAEEDRIDAMHSQYLIDQEETAGYKATIEELQADDAIQGLVQHNELLDGRIVDLRAQVAVMAAGAKPLREFLEPIRQLSPQNTTLQERCETFDKALSAAPKVVWHESVTLNEVGHIYVRAQSGYNDEGQYWLDDFLGAGHQQVEVFVAECSVKAGCKGRHER